MAGERIGKTYEAILKVVLDNLKLQKTFTGNVYWNESIDGVSVEPDFTIGKDKDHPSIVLMVTHSGSSKNSDMKTWRNLGELCELKGAITPSPQIFNIVFDTTIKEDLKKLQAAAFDGQLLIGDLVYGQEISEWVDANESLLPVDQGEKVSAIQNNIKTDTILKMLISKIKNDLKNCLLQPKDDLKQLWLLDSQRPSSPAPKAKETYIRRGMSKFLVFEDCDIALNLFRGKKVKHSEIGSYITTLGFAKKTLNGLCPTDEEILSAVKMLKDDEIKFLYHSMDNNETIQGYVEQLRNSTNIVVAAKYLCDEYDSLCNAQVLYKRLIQLHDDPNALVSSKLFSSNHPPADVWLFTIIFEVIKASTGQSNGYGYAQLANDVIERGYGTPVDLSSANQFGGGFGFSAWLLRKETLFKKELVDGIAHVLSTKLTQLGKSIVLECCQDILNAYIHNLIEAKLCTYKDFEPLFLILQKSIPKIPHVHYRTCFAEKAGLNGRSGVTTVALVGNTIINWQSSYEGHPADKTKELSGRAVGLRYTWDEKTKKFKKRPGVEKLILFLDGTWKQKHLHALVQAGWDEIFYPDEIDKLKNAII